MGKDYQQRKADINQHLKQMSATGRDISPIPDVVDPDRREACRLDFRLFCETYFAAVFNLAWSDDHLKAIAKIQKAIIEGGLFAFAFPRASGKTSLSVCAAEWSLLYGHRSFVVLIAATEQKSKELMESIQTDFEANDLLAEDFPEAIYPIRRLERITHRAAGQLLDGEPTRMSWTQNELILPTVPNSPSSGSVVKVAGITGSIRGMAVSRPSDGAKIRPDFVLIDDPQTDDSARSPMQIRNRMSTIMGAILGLAGPGKTISGFAAITVVQKGDVAEQLLDRKIHPEWQGERIKLLRSLPTNLKLWEQYAQCRADGLRSELGMKPATEFYLANQAALDEGAVASWKARFNPDEASAVQHAMNLKLNSEEAFFAEYQNEPMAFDLDTPLLLKPEQVTAKIVPGYERGIVPNYTTKLVAFADVQGTVLYWMVCAFGGDYSGHIVDYGCWPKQARSYFFLREVNPTLATAYPKISVEGQVRAGIDALTSHLLEKNWISEDGKGKQIDRMFVDAGWNQELVKQACQESKYKSRLLPSKGWGGTADKKPLDDWKLATGDRRGWSWMFNRDKYHVIFDTNSWKTFAATRLLSAAGEAGNLSLCNANPSLHRMLSEHITSEYPTPTEGWGRVVNVWSEKPNRENHWLDCLVGCYVAASEQGITFIGQKAAPVKAARRKLKVTF